MAERYVPCERLVDQDDVIVEKIAQIPQLCEPPSTTQIQFGESVALLDFIHEQTEDFDIFYSLWSTQVPADTYSVSLQFIDADGNNVHQVDNPLPMGDFAYRIDRIPRGTLPDDADITVNGIVYAWQTGARLMSDAGTDLVPLLELD